MRGAAHELDLVAERGRAVAEKGPGLLARKAIDHRMRTHAPLLRRLVDVDAVLQQVVDAAEIAPHADGPGDRCAADTEHLLDLVQQRQRLAALAIELVDEGHDRRVAQPADLHQLDGPLLDALGAVDDHQRRIDRGQRAIGVLREVLVAGRVEQVDHAARVRELHHARGDGDAALLLEAHPVGGRVPRRLAALYRAGELDRAAEQQELFGQRRLPGIGVGDDRKGAAPGHFVARGAHFSRDRGRKTGRNSISPRPGPAAARG